MCEYQKFARLTAFVSQFLTRYINYFIKVTVKSLLRRDGVLLFEKTLPIRLAKCHCKVSRCNDF